MWSGHCLPVSPPSEVLEGDGFRVQEPHRSDYTGSRLVDRHALMREFSGHRSVKVTSVARWSWYTAVVLAPNRPTGTRS